MAATITDGRIYSCDKIFWGATRRVRVCMTHPGHDYKWDCYARDIEHDQRTPRTRPDAGPRVRVRAERQRRLHVMPPGDLQVHQVPGVGLHRTAKPLRQTHPPRLPLRRARRSSRTTSCEGEGQCIRPGQRHPRRIRAAHRDHSPPDFYRGHRPVPTDGPTVLLREGTAEFSAPEPDFLAPPTW